MSTTRMTAVWDHSTHSGTTLLVLLAIADNANDDGLAWPGIRTLAQRARCGERAVKTHIQKAETSGELLTYRRKGQHNFYLVMVGLDQGQIKSAISRLAAMLKTSDQQITSALYAPVIRRSLPGDRLITTASDQARSPDPPLNHHEPPAAEVAAKSSPPPPTLKAEHDDLIAQAQAAALALPDRPNAFRLYEEMTRGTITSHMAETIGEAIDDYSAAWVEAAIKIAIENTARSWRYCKTILERWKREGKDDGRPAGIDLSGAQPPSSADASVFAPRPDCPRCDGMGFLVTGEVGKPGYGKIKCPDCVAAQKEAVTHGQ